MAQTETTRQSDEILPPIVGSILVLPLTTTILIVDLTTLAQTLALPQSTGKGSENPNPLGQYLTMMADAACFVAFGPTFASLSGIVNTTATSTVPQGAGATQGVIPSGNTANGVIQLPALTPMHFRMPPGSPGNTTTGQLAAHGTLSSARFLGAIMAAATTNLRVWVSSR